MAYLPQKQVSSRLSSMNMSSEHALLNVDKSNIKLVSSVNRYNHTFNGLCLQSRGKEKLLNVGLVNVITCREINK